MLSREAFKHDSNLRHARSYCYGDGRCSDCIDEAAVQAVNAPEFWANQQHERDATLPLIDGDTDAK